MTDETDEWIRENRDRLERLADSDYPANWVAEHLLDSVDSPPDPHVVSPNLIRLLGRVVQSVRGRQPA